MSDAHTTRLESALAGRYKVQRKLGEGGMASVYLAEDVKHERNVALKILKPELAAVIGAERFLAEIKTTANLQHPHILPLFDSGEAEGFLYYVMPYIEGETLAQKLARERQLGVDEAVKIAREVADALDYAHRNDVLHRDIKPANILLHDGRPVVADFGIAVAISAAGGGRMTETGLSLGTPHYMSPEQASADRDLNARSDVYSLGCVLYEMIAGQPPHTGPSAQSILVRILTESPRPLTEMRHTVPPHVAAVVAKAIEKLPADRFDSARQFMDALEDADFAYVSTPGTKTTASVTEARGGAKGSTAFAKRLPWGVAVTALAIAAWSLKPEPAATPAPTYRMALSDFVVESTQGGGWRVAISRDGSTVVAGGADDLLYVRRSDDTVFRPIPGSEFGRNPSISPDGEWVVFSQGSVSSRDSRLVKTQLAGGPVLPVSSGGGSPHWYSQDEIVFTRGDDVLRVSAAGGEGTLIEAEAGGRPFMLPGGRGILLDGPEGLIVYDIGSGETRSIALRGSNGRYVPAGYVLYGDRAVQSVFAVPFDLESLDVTGDPVPVLPSVNIFGGGAVQLAVSDNGTLVHGLAVTGGGAEGEERLTWIALDGTRTDLLPVFGGQQVRSPRVSPDRTRIAYEDNDVDEVFVYDLNTGEQTQVTDGLDAFLPTWSSDSSHLFVTGGGLSLHRAPADGSADPELLRGDMTGPVVEASPDGNWAVVEEWVGADGVPNLLLVRLDTDPVTIEPYLRAAWHEEEGDVSPDGRWLAYHSNQGGEHGVYVRSFPEPGPAIEIAAEADDGPVWAPDGSAIYFPRDDMLVRREVRLGETVELGEETVLFSVAGTRFSSQTRMYDIHPDGDRFLFVTHAGGEEAPEVDFGGIGPVVVVVNWFEELKARMGEGN